MEKQAANFTLSPPAALCPTTLVDRTAATELTADFSLPDYLPEIKRLLRVTATPHTESRYLSANAAEFDGAVDFLVCYAGGDGGMYSTRLARDYSISMPVDPDLAARGIDPFLDTRVESLTSRVTAPRKLNVRLRLRTRMRAYGEEDLTPTVEAAPAHLEQLIKHTHTMQILRADDQPLDLAEDIPLADAEGETRIVSTEGAVAITDVTPEDGAVMCRGELILTLITCAEPMGGQGESERRVCRIPFTRTVPLEGARGDMSARAWGICCDLSAAVEEDRILCDAAIRLTVEAAAERPLATVADLYALDGEIENAAYREIAPESLLCCGNYAVPMTATNPVASLGIDPAARIEDVSAVPQPDEITWAHGRAALSGSCRVTLVYALGGEYSTAEVVIPWKKEIECAAEPTAREIEMTVTRALARIDGEGERAVVTIDAELCAALRLGRAERRRILSHAAYSPRDGKKGGAVTVCYPESDESLWSIARRYHVSTSALAEANDLRVDENCDTPASLGGLRYLLISH